MYLPVVNSISHNGQYKYEYKNRIHSTQIAWIVLFFENVYESCK